MRSEYIYEGPVMLFGKCIDQFWRGATYAESEKKALSNLTYRYKKETGRTASAKITLSSNHIRKALQEA